MHRHFHETQNIKKIFTRWQDCYFTVYTNVVLTKAPYFFYILCKASRFTARNHVAVVSLQPKKCSCFCHVTITDCMETVLF